MRYSKCSRSKWDSPIKIRNTPTFYHSPIFDTYQQTQNHNMRYTATFRSNVFNQDIPPKNKQLSPTKSQRLENHDTAHTFAKPPLSQHTLLWFDPYKYNLINQSTLYINREYPKQRKLLQLSSQPLTHPQQNLSKSQYNKFCQQKQIQQTQKEVNTRQIECNKEIKQPICIKDEENKELAQEIKQQIQEKPEQTGKKQKMQKKVIFVEKKKPYTAEKKRPSTAAKKQSRNQPVYKLLKKQR